MELLSKEKVEIRDVEKGSEYISKKILLAIEGKIANSFVKGAQVEYGVKYDNNYVIFVTDDILNEETLRIYLFDLNAKLIDYLYIGSAYSTGYLQDLTLQKDGSISFLFIGDTLWNVKVLSKARMIIPFVSNPKGVSRKNVFSSFIQVRGLPKTET
ncbi:hypothetical protein [Photobacterium atrarenae]|uniref:Uncharacterized protein n=1 Tax=Photobacterium atrarenae TaxID=865757 RepID=A0ABY5GI34_9GAMM|nr:hypothetical protein [Photobacterium atrarenae]UTV28784.1 hypothetical protein NNL38_05945 [Photobacterium atrarenae]